MGNKEIFKDILGFEGMYQVSNLGRVKSCRRLRSDGRLVEECIMKQLTIKKGYKRISLYKDNKNRSFLVHRLVAMAFIPNEKNLPQIDHINYDTSDNRVENLRWCTARQNVHYCMENGRRYIITPEVSPNCRRVAKLDMQGKEMEIYHSLGEAHRQNPKSSISKISAVCRGERKSSGGFKWEFRSELPKSMKERSQHEKGIAIPIYQYNKDDELIAEFKSIGEAYRITHIHQTCIRKSLQGNYKTIEGYYFKYK